MPPITPIPGLDGLMYQDNLGGIFGDNSIYSAMAAPTTMQGLTQDLYSGNIANYGAAGAGFMPGSMGPSPGTVPGTGTGGWLDTMNGAWTKYGDMIQGIGGILQSGMGIYGMMQNIRLAKRSFEHQRKGDILSYNMMVQNQRNYQEDRQDINAGAAKARGRKVASEAERMAEVDRKSVPMWS